MGFDAGGYDVDFYLDSGDYLYMANADNFGSVSFNQGSSWMSAAYMTGDFSMSGNLTVQNGYGQYFDGSGSNVTLDGNSNTQSINADGGKLGAITITNSSYATSLTGDVDIYGGLNTTGASMGFDAGGYDVDFYLDGGESIDLSNATNFGDLGFREDSTWSSTITVDGSFDMSGDLYASSTGSYFDGRNASITFDGGGTSLLTSGGANSLQGFGTIDITNGTTLQPVTNDLKATAINVTSGTLDMATNDKALTTTGTLAVAASQNYSTGTGTQTLSGLNNSGTVTCESDGSNLAITTFTNNDGSLWNYTAGSGTVNMKQGTYHDLTLDDSAGSAVYTLGSGTTAVTGTLTNSDGTLAIGANTLNVTESVTNDDTVTISTGTYNVDGTTFDVGTLECTDAANINVAGSWSGVDSFISSTSTVTFDGGSTSTLASGGTTANYDFGTIDITNGTTLQPVTNDLKAATVNVTSGTLDMATNDRALTTTGTLTVAASQNYSTGTGTQTLGILDNYGIVACESDGSNLAVTTFTNNDGSTWQYTAAAGTVAVKAGTYDDLTFNDSSGTAVYTLQGATTLTGDLTITGGELDANGKAVNISGSWTNSDTFTANDNTVTFTGSGTSTISGNNTFSALSCTEAGKTLRIQAGTTQTIGNMTLRGSASSHLILASTSSTTAANIRPVGTANVSYLDVRYVNNLGSMIYTDTCSFVGSSGWGRPITVDNAASDASNNVVTEVYEYANIGQEGSVTQELRVMQDTLMVPPQFIFDTVSPFIEVDFVLDNPYEVNPQDVNMNQYYLQNSN